MLIRIATDLAGYIEKTGIVQREVVAVHAEVHQERIVVHKLVVVIVHRETGTPWPITICTFWTGSTSMLVQKYKLGVF